jgi:CIC family chloride channel protein
MMKVEIPRRLRAIVRARESSLVLLAAVVGAVEGIVVVAMATAVDLLHHVFFGLAPGERLSERSLINPFRVLLVPCLGGLLFGLTRQVIARRGGSAASVH